MLSLGVVPYLNAVPLIDRIDPSVRRVARVPALLGPLLDAGEVDAALLPVYEAFQGVGDGFLGRYGIVSRGAVTSVLLFLRTPLPAVRTLLLDAASRTSAGLARYLVHAATGGAEVVVREAPEAGADPREAADDAVLLIGDPAIRYGALWEGEVLDLGAAWARRTGLPFVYARWTARPGLTGSERDGLAALLDAAAVEGIAHRDELARTWALARGEDPEGAAHYVREHVHYHIGPDEEAGLARYGAIVRAQVAGRTG
jgi:chorismate dehydratase